MLSEVKFQIGKLGLTEGTIESLRLALKHHKRVRISVLKSSGRNKELMKSMALEIEEKLGNCDTRVIGFTIIIIRRLSKLKEKKDNK